MSLMKIRLEAWIELKQEDLAKAASRALEADNVKAPKDLKVSCRNIGSTLYIHIKHQDPSKILSTLNDLLTCLKPLTSLDPFLESNGEMKE